MKIHQPWAWYGEDYLYPVSMLLSEVSKAKENSLLQLPCLLTSAKQ